MSLEILKENLREVLIKNNGDIKLSEHRDVINDAKELGLDERQLSKLLQDVDSSINWDYIRKQKEDVIASKEKLKKNIEDQKNIEKNAEETLNYKIELYSRDAVFTSAEIKIFFDTSDELNQDEKKSANLLKRYFDQNNYIPKNTPKGMSVRQILQSTDWYKDTLPKQTTKPKKPPYRILLASSVMILFCSLIYWALLSKKSEITNIKSDNNLDSEINNTKKLNQTNSSNETNRLKTADSSQTFKQVNSQSNGNLGFSKSNNTPAINLFVTGSDLADLRKKLLEKSSYIMKAKGYRPVKIMLSIKSYSFYCDLIPDKTGFESLSLLWGPKNVGCESCNNALTKNPGSELIFKRTDSDYVYGVIAIAK